ncbi:hypothetical protein HPB47_007647 [Ixodes persulcatus]|uniref:Uncharacterized protein n=1 Tax=Ixodes persulcatus TaxID=34615 RepID=A0AC60P760_IXOPE|nr:hypothetical protein HPB47_007647 [Ixodes persulcatus]
MKEESTKVPLNVDLLQDRMMRTFQSRQELILSEAGVRTVLQEFPAVRIPGMLLQDVKLSFGKDILEDMKAKMEAFTASTLVFLKGKNVLLNFEELLEEDPGKVALLNLPLVFNEKRQLLFTTECTAVCEENLEEMGGNAAPANEFELPFSVLTPTEREMVVRTQNSGLALYEGAPDLPPAPRSPPQSDSG